MYPTNERETIELFKDLQDDLGWHIVHLQGPFPDAIIENASGKQLIVEFEYEARNFKKHKHDKTGCDLIICFRNNWIDAPLPVFALDQESAKSASVERFRQAYLMLATDFEKHINPTKVSNENYYVGKIVELQNKIKRLEMPQKEPGLWGRIRSFWSRGVPRGIDCPFCKIKMVTRCDYWLESNSHKIGSAYGYGNVRWICPHCGFKQSEETEYGRDDGIRNE